MRSSYLELGTLTVIPKKSKPPLKGQLTDREREPQELNRDHRHRATNYEEPETCRTASVKDQPPASQLTTEYTVKHNALAATGWGQNMQGQTKKYYPTIGGVEIF